MISKIDSENSLHFETDASFTKKSWDSEDFNDNRPNTKVHFIVADANPQKKDTQKTVKQSKHGGHKRIHRRGSTMRPTKRSIRWKTRVSQLSEEEAKLRKSMSRLTYNINALTLFGGVCFMYGMTREIVDFLVLKRGTVGEPLALDTIEPFGYSTIIPDYLCVVLMVLANFFTLAFYSFIYRKAYRICYKKFSIKWILWFMVPVCVFVSIGFSFPKIPSYSLLIVPTFGVISVVYAGKLLTKRLKVKERNKMVVASKEFNALLARRGSSDVYGDKDHSSSESSDEDKYIRHTTTPAEQPVKTNLSELLKPNPSPGFNPWARLRPKQTVTSEKNIGGTSVDIPSPKPSESLKQAVTSENKSGEKSVAISGPEPLETLSQTVASEKKSGGKSGAISISEYFLFSNYMASSNDQNND